eukprot:RCo005502
MALRFRVGQYNLLANCLADNLKPWFWYGYSGIQEDAPYHGDEFDVSRVQCFGYGRSEKLIKFWTLMKMFLKIFHTDYNYRIHLREFANPQEISKQLIPLLHQALVDFFYRDNLSSPEGDKDLAYHLFRRNSREYSLWEDVSRHAGLHLRDEHWPLLEAHRSEAMAATTVLEKHRHMVKFNATLRAALTAGPLPVPSFRSEEQLRQESDQLSALLRKLATFVCPSNLDLREIFAVQQQWNWDRRCQALVAQLNAMDVDVWALQELDELFSLRALLRPRYELAAFKQRAITPKGEPTWRAPKEDGVALFYNPAVFTLRPDGWLRVGGVRYSGAAAVRSSVPLQMRRLMRPYLDGVIPTESETFEGSQAEQAPQVPVYVFTDRLSPQDKDCFDDRVAVMAILRHIPSGQDVVFSSTHLYPGQNDIPSERIRAQECRQLDAALDDFCAQCGVSLNAPRVLLGDMNDPPDVAYFGRKQCPTAVYDYLVQESLWRDAFSSALNPTRGFRPCPVRPITTLTLNRQLPIDYILTKGTASTTTTSSPDGVATPAA